jgi:hypothetical protein
MHDVQHNISWILVAPIYALYRGTVTVPMGEVNELSYEHGGRWDARYGKRGRLLIKDGLPFLG